MRLDMEFVPYMKQTRHSSDLPLQPLIRLVLKCSRATLRFSGREEIIPETIQVKRRRNTSRRRRGVREGEEVVYLVEVEMEKEMWEMRTADVDYRVTLERVMEMGLEHVEMEEESERHEEDSVQEPYLEEEGNAAPASPCFHSDTP